MSYSHPYLKHILRPCLFFTKKCGMSLNPPSLVENFYTFYFIFFFEGFPYRFRITFCSNIFDISYLNIFSPRNTKTLRKISGRMSGGGVWLKNNMCLNGLKWLKTHFKTMFVFYKKVWNGIIQFLMCGILQNLIWILW